MDRPPNHNYPPPYHIVSGPRGCCPHLLAVDGFWGRDSSTVHCLNTLTFWGALRSAEPLSISSCCCITIYSSRFLCHSMVAPKRPSRLLPPPRVHHGLLEQHPLSPNLPHGSSRPSGCLCCGTDSIRFVLVDPPHSGADSGHTSRISRQPVPGGVITRRRIIHRAGCTVSVSCRL